MAFTDHITACNRHDLTRFRPFIIGGERLGWVSHDVAERLRDYPETLEVTDGAVVLSGRLTTPADRTAAMAEVLERLVERGVLSRLRGEPFAVSLCYGAPELMRIDRAAVPLFGVRAYGVHLNGFVRTGQGMMMWVGRRSLTKRVAPGKLDNIVAGGQPAGLSLTENLVKECAEEADIPRDLALRATPVGAITYCMEGERGLRPDCMFCYDIELPTDFVPRNTDGEMAEFMLWPVADVIETVRSTDTFKFNVNLVLIDFAIRHGFVTADDEPDYLRLLFGLRGPARPTPGHPLVDKCRRSM
ncbi:MAG: DUF4743 domain-containing protein [Alphaproteobacteria bacterium]